MIRLTQYDSKWWLNRLPNFTSSSYCKPKHFSLSISFLGILLSNRNRFNAFPLTGEVLTSVFFKGKVGQVSFAFRSLLLHPAEPLLEEPELPVFAAEVVATHSNLRAR